VNGEESLFTVHTHPTFPRLLRWGKEFRDGIQIWPYNSPDRENVHPRNAQVTEPSHHAREPAEQLLVFAPDTRIMSVDAGQSLIGRAFLLPITFETQSVRGDFSGFAAVHASVYPSHCHLH